MTVAAVIARDGRYLLVEEDTADGLRLNTPAGHLEPGESPQDGAVREALEETGRVFTPEALLGVYLAASNDAQGAPTTWLRFAFCGSAGAADPARREPRVSLFESILPAARPARKTDKDAEAKASASLSAFISPRWRGSWRS